MEVPDHAQKARLILAQCMIDVLRPHSRADRGLPVNERLIGYGIAAGVYAGQPVGISKLSEMTGLAKSTVRGVLLSLERKGWVIRNADKTYDFSEQFHANADEWFGLNGKYQAIIRAADGLRSLPGAG